MCINNYSLGLKICWVLVYNMSTMMSFFLKHFVMSQLLTFTRCTRLIALWRTRSSNCWDIMYCCNGGGVI